MIKRKNVLVIDDDPVFRLITKKMLEKTGDLFNGFFVENGLEGINFLKRAGEGQQEASTLPDIVFLDIEMPIMNGWGFMDEFQKLPSEKVNKIHIYTVSSSIAPEDKMRAQSFSQIKGYISKPLTLNILKTIADAHTD